MTRDIYFMDDDETRFERCKVRAQSRGWTLQQNADGYAVLDKSGKVFVQLPNLDKLEEWLGLPTP
jgi:hypothetical protein